MKSNVAEEKLSNFIYFLFVLIVAVIFNLFFYFSRLWVGTNVHLWDSDGPGPP